MANDDKDPRDKLCRIRRLEPETRPRGPGGVALDPYPIGSCRDNVPEAEALAGDRDGRWSIEQTYRRGEAPNLQPAGPHLPPATAVVDDQVEDLDEVTS